MSDETAVPLPETTTVQGAPDGTIPQAGVQVEIISQRIPLPGPEGGEAIRAALEPYEQDAVLRDNQTGGWVYVRTRAFMKQQVAVPTTPDETAG